MNGLTGVAASALVLWLASVLQIGLAPRLAIFGVAPDLFLVAIAPIALLSRPAAGATAGFFGGLSQGALAGANLTQYVLSRTVSGFACSCFRQLGLDLGFVLGGVATGVATIVAQTMLMLLAPPSNISSYLLATIVMAMYNGVLAMPLYALLKRILRPKAA